MPETVKNRSRSGGRRTGEPTTAPDSATVPDSTVPDSATTVPDQPAAADGSTDATGRATDTVAALDVDAIPSPDAVIGWAEAVPWLALRWGSTPTAAEVRSAPAVWAMLQDKAGRTALQMAADAELAGHTELDPTVLARVLTRYQKAGLVSAVTDGRLTRWSVIDPAEIVAQAQESARTASTSAARTGARAVTARSTGGGDVPAGGLRGMVEDYLAANPFEDFSPTQVANALGRSSGAVANALVRLVETGAAIQTSQAPRRYQHSADPDVTPATDPADDADDADEATPAEGAGE